MKKKNLSTELAAVTSRIDQFTTAAKKLTNDLDFLNARIAVLQEEAKLIQSQIKKEETPAEALADISKNLK